MAPIDVVAQLQDPGARQVGLVDVTRRDVLLGTPHARQVMLRIFLGEGFEWQRAGGIRKGMGGRLGEMRDQPRMGRGICLLRNRVHGVGRGVVNGKVLDAQRHRRTGNARRRQLQVGFDFRRQLVSQMHQPAANERQR